MTYDYFVNDFYGVMTAQVVEGANETMRIKWSNIFQEINTGPLVYEFGHIMYVRGQMVYDFAQPTCELNQRVIEDYLL